MCAQAVSPAKGCAIVSPAVRRHTKDYDFFTAWADTDSGDVTESSENHVTISMGCGQLRPSNRNFHINLMGLIYGG